jgi:exopolysaccharide biosynthesis polyprenyl glycosylphosphotransferase
MASGALKKAPEGPPPLPAARVGASAANGNGATRDIRARHPQLLRAMRDGKSWLGLARIGTLVCLDIFGVLASIFSALTVKALFQGDFDAQSAAHTTTDLAPFACLVTVLLFARAGLYGERHARPGYSRLLVSLFQVSVVSLVFALVEGHHFSSYFIFYGSLFFAAIYVAGLRAAYGQVTERLLHLSGYRRRVVLVGPGEQASSLARALAKGTGTAYDVVGFVSRQPSHNGLPYLGPLARLPDVLESSAIEEVIITDPEFPEDRALELVDACHRHGTAVRIAPSSLEVLVHRAEAVPGEAVPLFELKPPVFEGLDYVVKRTFDLTVSGMLLVVGAPLMLVTAGLVRLTSRGPVLYRSVRPGIGEHEFACLKFRTMRSDAEGRQARLEEMNEQTGAIFKIRNDPRTTAVGRVLRRFSLDELPQLINVLRGEMSLVGPRPLPLRDYRRLSEWHKRRYRVLPGITGLWQVAGRSDLGFDDMVRLDFLYLEQWSVLLDLTILLKTLPAVLRRRGAY